MSRYSLQRFEEIGAMLCGELGEKMGAEVFQKIIKTLGEGERVTVPRYRETGRLQTLYYWNPHRGRNPKLFSNVLSILCQRLGDATGIAMFKRLIINLGPGERLTVPFIACHDNRCKSCMRSCFLRLRRNEMIRNQFRGFNHKELAISYELSDRQIRRIVHGR